METKEDSTIKIESTPITDDLVHSRLNPLGNSLSASPDPRSVEEPFQAQLFRVCVGNRSWSPDIKESVKAHTPEFDFILNEPNRMLKSRVCPEEKVRALWAQKTRLDDIFDREHSQLYRAARESIFPLEKPFGGDSFCSRASYKFQELATAVPELLTTVPEMRNPEFLEMSGIPGSASSWIKRAPDEELSWKGIAWQLSVDQCEKSTEKPNHQEGANVLTVAPKKNVYNPFELDEQTAFFGDNIQLIVADGCRKVGKNPVTGEHLENYQEVFSHRILLSELLVALKSAKEGGSVVFKLYDMFSDFTVGIIYVVALLFKNCYVVKPRLCRTVNSERYLVGTKLLSRSSEEFTSIIDALSRFHQCWAMEQCERSSPHHLFPLAVWATDAIFIDCVKHAVVMLCEQQTYGLRFVIDKVKYLLNNPTEAQRVMQQSRRMAGRGSYRGRGNYSDRGGRLRGGAKGTNSPENDPNMLSPDVRRRFQNGGRGRGRGNRFEYSSLTERPLSTGDFQCLAPHVGLARNTHQQRAQGGGLEYQDESPTAMLKRVLHLSDHRPENSNDSLTAAGVFNLHSGNSDIHAHDGGDNQEFMAEIRRMLQAQPKAAVRLPPVSRDDRADAARRVVLGVGPSTLWPESLDPPPQ